jgi:hypothetical protein
MPFLTLQLLNVLFAAQHDHSKKNSRQHRADNSHHRAIHVYILLFALSNSKSPPDIARQMLFIIGMSSRMILNTTGPTVTTNNDGNIQKKIGNTNLTPNFAAFSSASWRVCTRM